MEPSLENSSIASAEGIPNEFWHKLCSWSSLLTKFLSVQIFIQALSLFGGILLVRKLSQQDYAFFTLANSLQATLLMLADVGLVNALSATGGKIWQQPERFGQLIKTGLALRKQLAITSMVVVVPILLWMVVARGAGYGYSLLLAAAVMLGVNFRLTNDVLTVVLRLNAKISQLQKLDLFGGLIRLLILLVGCITYINAIIAVLAASLAFGIQNVLLHKWARDGADLQQFPNAEDRHFIWSVIWQQAPNTLFYCVQGQLVVFLISIFGNTRNIAEVGALGRLTVIFTIISTVMTNIIVPRFARCQKRKQLLNIYKVTIAGFGVLSILLMMLAIFLPGPLLWILGKQYSHLKTELVYSVLTTVVYSIGGAIYSMNAARAWTRTAWLSIPIVLVGQVIFVPFLNLSSVKDVILLNTIPAIFSIIPYVAEAYFAFKHLPSES